MATLLRVYVSSKRGYQMFDKTFWKIFLFKISAFHVYVGLSLRAPQTESVSPSSPKVNTRRSKELQTSPQPIDHVYRRRPITVPCGCSAPNQSLRFLAVYVVKQNHIQLVEPVRGPIDLERGARPSLQSERSGN